MFIQILEPTGNLFVTRLVALIPVVPLLVMLAGWTIVLLVTSCDRRRPRPLPP
jgi:hypothetical protein